MPDNPAGEKPLADHFNTEEIPMKDTTIAGSALLGAFICLGLAAFGYLISNAVIAHKLYDRHVTVKGLSEREYNADIVIWPIQFTVADNDLTRLYNTMEGQSEKIRSFLVENGILQTEITLESPAITDKSAQQYGDTARAEFRYTAVQTVTVYSKNIEAVRKIMGLLSQLGKSGIVFMGEHFQTEYLFTRLNEVKPEMIEEATTKAREVAEKFAADSKSVLGKIKSASQGQFTITERDRNNPHIKHVRVVSTVAYYLSD